MGGVSRTRDRVVPIAIAVVSIAVAFAVTVGARVDAAYPGDNGRIIYDLTGQGAEPSIRTMGPTGASPSSVGGFTDAVMPAWSADGTRVAFARLSAEARGIWIMDADGSDARRLTIASGDVLHYSPAWSPSGDQIMFVYRYQNTNATFVLRYSSLVTVEVASGTLTTVIGAGNGEYYTDPVYSPLGDRIAYITSVGSSTGGQEVWTAFVNGTDRRQLTRTENAKARPDWSPDGARIVYQDGTGTTAELAVVSASALEEFSPNFLTKNSSFDGLPVWSPDGSRIAYYAEPPPTSVRQPAGSSPPGIYTIRPDGSGRTGPLGGVTIDGRVLDTDWQAIGPPPPPTTSPGTTSPGTTSPGTTPPGTTPPSGSISPVLSIDRPVAPTGEVPMVSGLNFPGDTDVLLRWEPGIGSGIVHTNPDGTFAAQFLVMGNDVLGDRLAIAEIGGVVQATAPLLVVENSFQPAGLDSTMIARR